MEQFYLNYPFLFSLENITALHWKCQYLFFYAVKIYTVQVFLYHIYISSLNLFFQSYALYVIGDENATSTDVSKYLAKLSAGLLVTNL